MENILYKVFIVFIVAISFISCNSNNNQTSEKVKVYKYDEAIGCISEGISLKEMSLELMDSNITVYCAQKNHDGLVYRDECGVRRGSINVYLIHKNDLENANTLGFQSVDQLEKYIDEEGFYY